METMGQIGNVWIVIPALVDLLYYNIRPLIFCPALELLNLERR